jgi:hypothetical protein
MMVFHSPHESHFPCQRCVIAPQFWQTYEERALAKAERFQNYSDEMDDSDPPAFETRVNHQPVADFEVS